MEPSAIFISKMSQILFIFTLLILGFSGLITQVFILRELFASFYGNELVLGIILSNWVLLQAIGSFAIGEIAGRIKNKAGLFLSLEIIFALSLPFSIYLCRIFKPIIGINPFEAVGLPGILLVSFLINFFAGLSHGGLFSVISAIFIREDRPGEIGKAYAWAAIGAISGAALLTYVFIPYFNVFQAVFLVSLLNIFISLFYIPGIENKKIRRVVLLITALIVLLFLKVKPSDLDRQTINQQYAKLEVLEYRNSVYGNLVVTKNGGQEVFFYNGLPIITLPYPDITFVEESGNLPLLFHESPKDVLIVSGGFGGLINEVLKNKPKSIDYIELDPLVMEMVRKYSTSLTSEELSDLRLNLINTDARFFIRNSLTKYDVILVGFNKPSDLSVNRFFTKEFFSLAKDKLRPDGLIAFSLPGSLTYLSSTLRDLNVSVLNALKLNFKSIRIIPGDYNLFLASDADLNTVTPMVLEERLKERSIKTNLLIPSYLEYRLDKKFSDWFMASVKDATQKINHDLTPFAVFQALLFWSREFSPVFSGIFALLEKSSLSYLFILILALTLLLHLASRKMNKSVNLALLYVVFTTGFFAMLSSLMSIFAFQVFHGYLYYKIGLLMSLFMAGVGFGGLLAGRMQADNILGLVKKTEFLLIAFSLIQAFIIVNASRYINYASVIIAVSLFTAGLFLGLEFAWVSKLYIREKINVGRGAGILYACDLLGGWLAAILAGILFLPVLGLFNTFLLIAGLKLSSFILLITAKA